MGLVQTVDEAVNDPGLRSLGMLHMEPRLHCRSPILGMPTRLLRDVPQLNAQGAAVREKGWASLQTTAEVSK
ncbi:hypothetical protein D3C87_2117080 [compost metagenome]